jgi:hypothetical protein
MEGLQRKPGQGIDLRTFGVVAIKRASEVLWDEDKQMWFVKFFDLPDHLSHTGVLTLGLWQTAAGTEYPVTADMIIPSEDGFVLFYGDYDSAVKAEISALDGLRIQGLLH